MDTLYEELEEILEQYVRPNLKNHGGDIMISNIKDGVAYVKFQGHCSNCPSAKYTMESLVKEEVLTHTSKIKDLVLQEEVSQELIDFAKKLMHT